MNKLPNRRNDIKKFFKERENLTQDELLEDIKKVFEEEEKQKAAERNDLKEFSEIIANESPKQKAYRFLEYFYNKYSTSFGDDEFLVLLISRGGNFKDFQSRQYELWKNKSIEVKESAALSFSNSETAEDKVVRNDVEKSHHYEIPNFWAGRRNEVNTIDATMLRVAQWCKISGFDGYWKRLFIDVELNVPFNLSDRLQRIQWMFSICRCEYAIDLMFSKLSLLIEILIIPDEQNVNNVWEYLYYDPKTLGKEVRNSAFITSGLLFILIRLGLRNKYKNLILEAKEFLIKIQTQEGGWKRFSNDENISIETTAMCIHALSLVDYDSLSYVIKKGVACIYAKQDIWGFWFEDNDFYVSSEYLTVLVLDAIEIEEGNFHTLTFEFVKSMEELIAINQDEKNNQPIIYNVYHMRDNYNIEKSQVGAIGNEAKAESNSFQQIIQTAPDNFDFDVLFNELEKLKNVLKLKAEEPEEFLSLSNVVSAQKASKEKNYGKAVDFLKTGGKWVFDTAKEIGVSVVAELINKQMQ